MRSTTLVMAGRYRLEERIAAGGVGEVWRGHDTVLDRAVAVKLLQPAYTQHPEALVRFRAEARHAAGVSHPGIAQVYDYGEADRPFLVMELVNGPSLATVLVGGPLDARTVMDIVAQTATALQAAHAAGLVHRDIKPANLLLGPGGQVKITDFGIAYAAGSAPLTRTGTLIGTPAYLAPERVAGMPASPASDLYSLGIVCHECLTGERLFTGTPVEIALAHEHGQLPPLPPHVPAQVVALAASLTAKDPAARPASAAEAAHRAAQARDTLAASSPGPIGGRADLPPTRLAEPLPATLTGPPSQIMANARISSRAIPAPKPPQRSHLRRGRMLLLAAGAVVIAAALAGWLLAGGRGAARPQQHHAPASTIPAAPRLADVNPALLAGQPVAAVRRQLGQLGLRVQVIWRHNGHQRAGTVVSVAPSGRLPAGTTVVVTGALAPHGHGDSQGNGGGNSGPGD